MSHNPTLIHIIRGAHPPVMTWDDRAWKQSPTTHNDDFKIFDHLVMGYVDFLVLGIEYCRHILGRLGWGLMGLIGFNKLA